MKFTRFAAFFFFFGLKPGTDLLQCGELQLLVLVWPSASVMTIKHKIGSLSCWKVEQLFPSVWFLFFCFYTHTHSWKAFKCGRALWGGDRWLSVAAGQKLNAWLLTELCVRTVLCTPARPSAPPSSLLCSHHRELLSSDGRFWPPQQRKPSERSCPCRSFSVNLR